MGAKINGETTVSEDSAFRLGHFDINGKRLNVPLQALDIRKYYDSKIDFGDLKVGVSEAFVKYNKKKLEKFREFPDLDRKEDAKIKLWKDAADKVSSSRFLFTRFEGPKYPTIDEMKTLITKSHSFSDATPLPALPDVFKELVTRTKRNGQVVQESKIRITDEKFKKHKSFLDTYIQLLEGWNHKDILGWLPTNWSTRNIAELIDYYYSKGINHFYLDLGTATFKSLIGSPLMTGIVMELNEIGLEYQKTFLYSINSSPGRFTANTGVIGSKDILMGGAGIDTIGRNHLAFGSNRQGKPDPRIFEKLKFNKIRLFNKSDYGYYRLNSKKLPFKLPDDSILDEKILTDINKGKAFSQIFNMQQLVIENQNIQTYIKENNEPLKIIEKEKNKAEKEDIKAIKDFRTKKLGSLI
ncbi:MAG: hypothetical protein GON13_02365 [Nanoarchaeota archaeon]|nr:hypothetical protein [Nanoarchaeota archaeon]